MPRKFNMCPLPVTGWSVIRLLGCPLRDPFYYENDSETSRLDSALALTRLEKKKKKPLISVKTLRAKYNSWFQQYLNQLH